MKRNVSPLIFLLILLSGFLLPSGHAERLPQVSRSTAVSQKDRAERSPLAQSNPLLPMVAPARGKALTRAQASLSDDGLSPAVVSPPGCALSTATFTNSTPVAISPTGTPLVTSTIIVSGAGTYLYDLNVTTFITHTFNDDLDITITSPSGKVVTLTTDNGGNNDNVFNGTVWDDDADPGNQVPYTFNQNLVTEHTYANLTLASPLVPEEALGAFIGEDPNGTWTLTIQDDLNGDGGSLSSWSLNVNALQSAPTTSSVSATNSTPVAISTSGTPLVTSTIVVAGAGTAISDVNLTTFITHTFSNDLDVTITSPSGTVVTLTTDNGGSNDNVFNGTVWDDDADPGNQVPYSINENLVTEHTYANLTLASPLVPEEPLAAFTGEDPNGTWTLTIQDDLGGDGGSLNSWSLNIQTAQCSCSITCPANQTLIHTPNQAGAIVTYPAPVTSGSCGVITCAPASGSFFNVGTTPVICSEPTSSSTTTYSSGNVAVPIPAAGTGPSAMTPQVINIPDGGTIQDLNLGIRLNHTFDADLEITLTAPNGTTSVLVMDDDGSSGDNLGAGANDCSGTKTIFDDEAATSISAGTAPFGGSFIPLSALSAFDGMNSAGAWTLSINDDLGGDSGTLFCWELAITTTPVANSCTFNVTVEPSTLSISDVSVVEGDSGSVNATFTVTQSIPSSQTVIVDYFTSNGTATEPGDYTAVNGPLFFSPGQTSRTITVPVNGDTLQEGAETFMVTLMNPTNATIADGVGVGTITDNEAPIATLNFSQSSYGGVEDCSAIVATVNRTGSTANPMTVHYATVNGSASDRSDYTAASGTLTFAPGDTSKTIPILISEDSYTEGTETFSLALSNPTGGATLGGTSTASMVILDDLPESTSNPIDNSQIFVCQHYHDFLNREPDPAGLAFWTNGIESCGADASCREAKRIDTSAAFFLSIEFQETSGTVERAFRAAFNRRVLTSEYLPDSQQIGRGFVFGQPGSDVVLEANKAAYYDQFITRPEFVSVFGGLTNEQFVDALNGNTGGSLSPAERDALVAALNGATKTRAQALRSVVEDADFVNNEFTRAFVLAEYFGYLRRDPDEPGFNFWLNKLNSFSGDFRKADMVKAFLSSSEYRQRFGP